MGGALCGTRRSGGGGEALCSRAGCTRPATHRCGVTGRPFFYDVHADGETLRARLAGRTDIGADLADAMARLAPYWDSCVYAAGDRMVVRWRACDACVTDDVRAHFHGVPRGWRERADCLVAYEGLRLPARVADNSRRPGRVSAPIAVPAPAVVPVRSG